MGDRVAGTDTARREHSEMVAGPSGNHRGPSTGSTTHLAAAEQSAASVMGTGQSQVSLPCNHSSSHHFPHDRETDGTGLFNTLTKSGP